MTLEQLSDRVRPYLARIAAVYLATFLGAVLGIARTYDGFMGAKIDPSLPGLLYFVTPFEQPGVLYFTALPLFFGLLFTARCWNLWLTLLIFGYWLAGTWFLGNAN